MSIIEIGNELVGAAESLTNILKELTKIADKLTKLCNALKAEDGPAPVPQAPVKKTPELAEVRALLADVSRSGKTAEVKALLESYGCSKLSEVKPESYEGLMEKARELL
mgnify:CR=1 FL=1